MKGPPLILIDAVAVLSDTAVLVVNPVMSTAAVEYWLVDIKQLGEPVIVVTKVGNEKALGTLS